MKNIHPRSLSSKIIIVVLFLFQWGNVCHGQTKQTDLLAQLSQEDSSYISAIVLYPDSIRNAIFIASGNPEILVKLDEMTGITREKFNKLIAPYDMDSQSKIWELSRYPDLLTQMTTNGKLTKKEIKYITYGYPENIQDAALELGIKEHEMLTEINHINTSYQTSFERLISTYPEEVKTSYKTLLNLPEILEILSNNLRTTILIGDAYKRDPKGIMKQAERMNLEIARKNAEELKDWQNELQSDSSAMNEFTASAKEYAKSQGYAESDYTAPVSNTTIIIHEYPYPYWIGYPYWHSYAYWYPYPWWYDWGFYYGPFGEIVFIGLPSYHFSYWYFYDHHHHHTYPHFTNHCINHYSSHRTTYTSINVVTYNWKTENESLLNDNWLSDKPGRVERIKEFGKMEIDREIYNQNNPNNKVSKDVFFESKANNYPKLKEYKQPNIKKTQPIKEMPNEYYKYVPSKQTPIKNPNSEKPLKQNFPYQTDPRNTKPTYPSKDHNRAKDLHQGNWIKTEPKAPNRPITKPNPVIRPQAVPPTRPAVPKPKTITKPPVKRGG